MDNQRGSQSRPKGTQRRGTRFVLAKKNQRSSSEAQRGRRKRGFSETECPTQRKRDNIITCGLQSPAEEMIRFYEGINGVPSAPQTAIRAASAPRAESQNVSRSEDQSELESCVRSLELFSIDFHKDLDDLMNMLPELESSTRVLGIILSQALEAASVPQSQNVSRSEGLSEVVPHLSSLMLDRIRKDLDDLMNMMSELKSSMGVLRIILSQVPEAASVPQSQNVRRSEGLSEVKSFAETMELNKENIKKVVAKMKPMMPYLRIILQQRIKSQSQAPNAASTPQAAPAPEPSVVVKDEDEDDEEGEEA
ncbi:hypothetical protein HF521_010009 [Silurus meridionalis]|uniref:Uncharacterized protein n=1 Tax=Silurus meridionalis TaxID=175797 RepID=A0A8T0AKZ9_SILME|nr:hypothetical protein HF521_010009 [Silurus meridionalis]